MTFVAVIALLIFIFWLWGIGSMKSLLGSGRSAWGWRVPFLISIVLLGVSLWIRMQLAESPVFQKMKDEGTTSKAPLTEAFGRWSNAKWVLIALLGLGTMRSFDKAKGSVDKH